MAAQLSESFEIPFIRVKTLFFSVIKRVFLKVEK